MHCRHKVSVSVYFLFFIFTFNLLSLSAQTDSLRIELVKDIRPGGYDSSPYKIFNFNGVAYFLASEFGNPSGYALWKSDGTEAGTQLVIDLDNPDISDNYSEFTVFHNKLFFRAAQTNGVGYELWVTDGTAEGSYMVKDIYEGTDSGNPGYLTVKGDTLLFIASSIDSEGVRTGAELWGTNGTTEGTYMVKQIFPGINSGTDIDGFNSSAVLNGIYYFAAKGPNVSVGDQTIGGLELWRSDGTEEGTYIVVDLTPTYTVPYGEDWSRPYNLTIFKNKLLFSAYRTDVGNELFQYDYSLDKTTLLKDIFPNDGSGTPCGNSSISSYPGDFIVTGGFLFFFACDGIHGRELWVTDGTEKGTNMVIDMTPGENGTTITEQTVFNGMLYFVYDDGDEKHGRELWRTNGTAEGTILLKDIATGVDEFERALSSDPKELTVVNNLMYFSAWSPEYGRELWVTDGTAEGTKLFQEMDARVKYGGNPNSLTNINGTLFFSATSDNFVDGLPRTGYELWKVSSIPTGVEQNSLKFDFKLQQNYPNPFNPTTIISFSIPRKAIVTLKIFDILGEEVKVLLNEQKSEGKYNIEFNASSLPSGIYFYRLLSGNFSETKKLVLLR
ncbi:MAG: T9SS type A sorting domain-containing protein [Calditrichaeota bacterium]|nr:T9SS type A sorting domain-containing protein [Calditrichota bacterium]